jgi:hypothetical protein
MNKAEQVRVFDWLRLALPLSELRAERMSEPRPMNAANYRGVLSS